MWGISNCQFYEYQMTMVLSYFYIFNIMDEFIADIFIFIKQGCIFLYIRYGI